MTTFSEDVKIESPFGANFGANAAPAASSILELTSTSKGFLAPRMTSVQRTAIASPAVGLQVYDTNDLLLYIWDGTTWVQQGSVSIPVASPTVTGTVTSYFPVIQSAVNLVSGADYTVLTTDGYEDILVSTGATDRTISLPAAASNAGRVINIKKTDSGVGIVTIDPNGAELIDDASAYVLYGQYWSVSLACDGTGWVILSSKSWPVAFTPNLSTGSGILSTVNTYWWIQDGKFLRIRGSVHLGTVLPSDAYITLPNSLVLDVSVAGEAYYQWLGEIILFNGALNPSIDRYGQGFYDGISADRIYFGYRNSASGFNNETWSGMFASNTVLGFDLIAPVVI